MVRVACAQTTPAIGDVEGNRSAAAVAIRRAAAAGAGVVVLPELCTSGYVFRDRDEALKLAEPADGPAVRSWCELSAAHRLVIVGGLCELAADGALFNSAVVVDGGEVAALYRKTHLWDREKLVFAPGDDPLPVARTAAGAIGVAVCFDTFFPETLRALALAGAELVAVPMNNPVLGAPLEPLPVEIVLTAAAAATNRIFIAQCDRAGAERGVAWVGASAVIDPDGRVLTKRAQGETLLTADVDLARARDKRLGERNDAFADRRPELYAGGRWAGSSATSRAIEARA